MSESISWRKIFLPAEAIAPIGAKLAEQCGQDGASYRLELYDPMARRWCLCGFAPTDGFNAARAAQAFAERAFERLDACDELPPSPQNLAELISREDFIANLGSMARFRRPGEV